MVKHQHGILLWWAQSRHFKLLQRGQHVASVGEQLFFSQCQLVYIGVVGELSFFLSGRPLEFGEYRLSILMVCFL